MNYHKEEMGSRAIALSRPRYNLKYMLVPGILFFLVLLFPILTHAATAATISLPWNYSFSSTGVLNESGSPDTSGSPYWWVSSGGQLIVSGGVGQSLQGQTPSTNPWYGKYLKSNPIGSDKGVHPQNSFSILARSPQLNSDSAVSVKINQDNLSNSVNRNPWNGVFIMSRWQNDSNFYYAGIRADGHVIIKKKVNGAYYTLAEKAFFPGTYNSTSNPDILPKGSWVRLRNATYTDSSGNVHIDLYVDKIGNGSWQLALSAIDNGTSGAQLGVSGLSGLRSDFMDISLDNWSAAQPVPVASVLTSTPPPPLSTPTPTPSPVPTPTPTPTPSPTPSLTNYDSTVLSGNPVMYLTMSTPSTGGETDKSGHGNNGTYKGGTPTNVILPNGDTAADFNGSGQYLTVSSNSNLSIPTTKQLTWEAWIRPDTLQFPSDSGYGYIDFMGKCQDYGPTCEWESRMYSTSNPEGRTNRISAYVFNPSAGLGSAADWQPNANLLQSGQWLHVVGEYDTTTTPSGCSSNYPGSINIWVNGVKWSAANHFPTGCMSQYSVIPRANNSSLNIATMAMETWFKGAIGKVAIYNRLLSQTEINQHFQAMTGATPSGSCASTCSIPVPTP